MPLAASPPQCDEPKARARGQSLCPSALSPPRPALGPLPDQRGGPHVALYCMAFILLGSWGRDPSWLFPTLPAQSAPSIPSPQGLLCLCQPLAAPAVAFAHAKYSFWKDLFSLIRWPPSSLPCTVREGKPMGGKVDRLTTQAKSLWDVSSVYGNPGPCVQFCPHFSSLS